MTGEWTVIICCLVFMCWWPYHLFQEHMRTHEPQEEECPRCGRMVEHIDLHVRYCKGQITRRNPLSVSTVFKSFKTGENVDKL